MAAAAAPQNPSPTPSGELAEYAASDMPASVEAPAAEESAEVIAVQSAARYSPSGAPPPPPPRAARPGSMVSGTPGKSAVHKPALGSPAAAGPTQSPVLALTPRSDKGAPLLIYSATVTMAVFGTAQALEAVEQLARRQNGYLVRRNDTSITVRVPAAAFEGTLNGLAGLGDELHRDVNARDVTEEYADLEIRLRNSEVVRQRLEALLAKASSVEDALAVERELERVAGNIEQLKGKLKLLSELVSFSTITVNFQPRAVERVNNRTPLPFEWLQQLGLSNLLSL